MYTIYANVTITRRKTLCFVCDNNAQVLYTTKRLVDALLYSWDRGHQAVYVHTGNQRVMVQILDVMDEVEPLSESNEDLPVPE